MITREESNINKLNENQKKAIQKQCGYVPFYVNKSKAMRLYYVRLFVCLVLFIITCGAAKLDESLIILPIAAGVFMVVSAIIQGLKVLQKHMINNLDDATIIGQGVVTDKNITYLNGLHRLFNRDHNREVTRQYITSLEVSLSNGENKRIPCTNTTFEHAAKSYSVILLEFPEDYELGRYCCFLEKDYIGEAS